MQNPRFLLLAGKGQSPNLASQAMGAALRALPDQGQQRFGYRPLLAESFTDPEAHAGTCYKASNGEPVGFSAGYRRHRADFYLAHERPRKLWLRPLVPHARQRLRAAQVPEDCRAGLSAPPVGTLPVNAGQLNSLLEVFRRAPDPRSNHTHYRVGPGLTLIALALLAGRREIAEIARFATTLTQAQRRRLNLPLKQGTRFYQVPGYGVFHQVLTRLDAEAFAPCSMAGCKPAPVACPPRWPWTAKGFATTSACSPWPNTRTACRRRWRFTTRRKTPRAAHKRRRRGCWRDCPPWTASSSRAIRCTASGRTPGPWWKKAAIISSRSKATNPGCSNRPKAWTHCRPPLFIHRESGHGRVQTWRVAAFALEPLTADFPFARTLSVVRSERTIKRTGQTSLESRYYLSSVPASDATPRQWLAWIRGHWGGVEVCNHWRRDALMGEDRSRSRHPTLLANGALIRNALLAVLSEALAEQSLPQLRQRLHSHPGRGLALLARS